MSVNLIGRNREVRELNELYDSGKAELVAVYGRRRVGKTFLVDEVLEGKISFRHAGLSPAKENRIYDETASTRTNHKRHLL